MSCITFENLSITIEQFVNEANDGSLFVLLGAAFIMAIASLAAFFIYNK